MNQVLSFLFIMLFLAIPSWAEPREEILVTPEFAEEHGIYFYAKPLKQGCNGALFAELSGYPSTFRDRTLASVQVRTVHGDGQVTEFYLEHNVPAINFCYPKELLDSSEMRLLYYWGKRKLDLTRDTKNIYLIINDFSAINEKNHNNKRQSDA